MNPIEKKFEKLPADAEMLNMRLAELYGKDRKKDQMPVFKFGEEIQMRGALWKVCLLQDKFIKFRYLRMLRPHEIDGLA